MHIYLCLQRPKIDFDCQSIEWCYTAGAAGGQEHSEMNHLQLVDK